MPDIAMLSMGCAEYDDTTGDLRVINALTDAGFPLRICTSVHELFGLLGTGTRPTIVLDVVHSAETDGFLLCQALQSTPHRGVVLFVGPTQTDRNHGWTSGADICLSAPVQGAELIAALNVLHRRMAETSGQPVGFPDMPASGPGVGAMPPLPSARPQLPRQRPWEAAWVLENSGWRLRSPRGNTVDLSTAERAFMIQIFRCPSRLLYRDQLNTHLPEPSASRRGRSVDVMVMRLRRKVSSLAGNFPLYSRRGVGYQFAESCAIDGDASTEAWSPSVQEIAKDRETENGGAAALPTAAFEKSR